MTKMKREQPPEERRVRGNKKGERKKKEEKCIKKSSGMEKYNSGILKILKYVFELCNFFKKSLFFRIDTVDSSIKQSWIISGTNGNLF